MNEAALIEISRSFGSIAPVAGGMLFRPEGGKFQGGTRYSYFISKPFELCVASPELLTNKWTKKADFGGTARAGAVGFSIGTKGYIGTGMTGPSLLTKDFWEYDPATDKWTQKGDFGGIERFGAVGFSIGNKGYLGTGIDVTDSWYNPKDAMHKDFWEYNPETDIWTQKTDFAGTKRVGAAGFAVGNRGYLGAGGFSWLNINYCFQDFWEYEPISNTWTKKADFGGTACLSVGFSIGSKGYIGMGEDQYNALFYKEFWEYDAVTALYASFTGNGVYKYNGTTWSKLNATIPADMAASRTDLYASFTGNGVYKYNGTAWSRIHTLVPAIMTASGTELYASFTGHGIYKYNGTAWTRINTLLPTIMAASGTELYACFTGYGIYKYNGTAWSRIHTLVPAIMTASGTELYASFTGYGIYKYN